MNLKAILLIALEVVIISACILFFAPLGYLGIETEPSGAFVHIDGDPSGRAPIYLAFVTPRTYQIDMTKEGFAPLTVQVTAHRFARTINKFKLEKVFSYELNTDPPGATVLLDGKQLEDTTPLKVRDLKAGKYVLRFDKEGYPSIAYVVDTTTTLPSLLLSFHEGIDVTFNSNPPGAKLVLDGRPVGTTPCRVQGLVAKRYRAELVLEEYEKINQRVDLWVTGNIVNFTLRKLHPIYVLTDPPGQVVEIDGIPEGKSPLTAWRVEGQYEVSIGKAAKLLTLPKESKVFIPLDVEEEFVFIDRTGKKYDVKGIRSKLSPKIPKGEYKIALPIKDGIVLLGTFQYDGKPLKIDRYNFSKDGKTIIRSFGGSRTIEVIAPKEKILLGEGEAVLDIGKIAERIGNFKELTIEIGQGNWSTNITLSLAEIASGIVVEVEVMR